MKLAIVIHNPLSGRAGISAARMSENIEKSTTMAHVKRLYFA